MFNRNVISYIGARDQKKEKTQEYCGASVGLYANIKRHTSLLPGIWAAPH